MALITFKIDKQNKVHIDVSGVEDASCEDITRAFEEALGVKTDIQRKPNYYVELDTLKVYEN
jgi:hypothetical protein